MPEKKDEVVKGLCAITSTPGHKYYVPENTEIREINENNEHASYNGLSVQWVSAVNLRPGDKVLLSDGKYAIVQDVKVRKLDKPETTYNFEVEDFHTYYVGEQGVCVHNSCKYFEARSFADDETLILGKEISRKQAIARVQHGGNVYVDSRAGARSLAKSVGIKGAAMRHPATKVGYYFHFHDGVHQFSSHIIFGSPVS